MTVTRNANYEGSIELYLEDNDWIDDSSTPLVTQLYKIARILDAASGMTRGIVGLTTEWRMTFNALHNMKPEGSKKVDKDSDEEFFASIGL